MSRAARRGLPSTPGVQAPADRHYRRPDVRPGRRRRFGLRLMRVARFAILALVVAGAAGWLWQSVGQSRLLDVDRVVVRGNERLSDADVQTLLDGLRGEHILGVDFETYRRRLLGSPWVESVTLWRLLPSTIEVTIVERVPMAIARLGDELFLVDRTGIIIDAFGPAYRDLDLPIVDGLLRAPASRGSFVDPERVEAAGGFLAALAARPDLLERLSQVDVSNPHDLVVLLADDPVLLHVGDRSFAERLDRYLDWAPALGERFEGLDYVDLRFDDQVVVRAAANR